MSKSLSGDTNFGHFPDIWDKLPLSRTSFQDIFRTQFFDKLIFEGGSEIFRVPVLGEYNEIAPGNEERVQFSDICERSGRHVAEEALHVDNHESELHP